MASITTLLVVLTLTGEPVVNALCIVWCDTSSATMNCVEAIAQTTMAELTPAAGAACDAALTISPFVREEGRDGSRTAVVTSVSASVIAPEETQPAPILGRVDAIDGRRAPPLVLRI
jgi:hypothetical protein